MIGKLVEDFQSERLAEIVFIKNCTVIKLIGFLPFLFMSLTEVY